MSEERHLATDDRVRAARSRLIRYQLVLAAAALLLLLVVFGIGLFGIGPYASRPLP